MLCFILESGDSFQAKPKFIYNGINLPLLGQRQIWQSKSIERNVLTALNWQFNCRVNASTPAYKVRPYEVERRASEHDGGVGPVGEPSTFTQDVHLSQHSPEV